MKNNRLYEVFVRGFSFLRPDTSMKAARRWAAGAFPQEHAIVKSAATAIRCGDCDCQPCCCDTRNRHHLKS